MPAGSTNTEHHAASWKLGNNARLLFSATSNPNTIISHELSGNLTNYEFTKLNEKSCVGTYVTYLDMKEIIRDQHVLKPLYMNEGRVSITEANVSTMGAGNKIAFTDAFKSTVLLGMFTNFWEPQTHIKVQTEAGIGLLKNTYGGKEEFFEKITTNKEIKELSDSMAYCIKEAQKDPETFDKFLGWNLQNYYDKNIKIEDLEINGDNIIKKYSVLKEVDEIF